MPGSQLEVLHVTVPLVPEPAATPHLVAQPVGSLVTHLPSMACVREINKRQKEKVDMQFTGNSSVKND